MLYDEITKRKYIVIACIIVAILIVIALYKKQIAKRNNIDYAYNIILNKNKRYSNTYPKQNISTNNKNNATGTIIPEEIIRRMVPSDILDKYYPDSLKNNMPHRRQIEHFDTNIIQDQRAVVVLG